MGGWLCDCELIVMLRVTRLATPKRVGVLFPCNVCHDGTASTINTRYAAHFTVNYIFDLARFPRTVLLIVYEN